MRLMQFLAPDGQRQVAATMHGEELPRVVHGVRSTRDLALEARRATSSLATTVAARGLGAAIDPEAIEAEGRLLPPLDHPEPSRCVIGITGLTHLGSAASRDAMHARMEAGDVSDSMRMFRLGLEGGKPAPGRIGAQPEWAYKGDGDWVVPPGRPLPLPSYAEDGGEEAEIVGLYVVGDHGEVLRLGYALGNEFSDHVMERRNYLYLAHSKLRACSFGPEVLVGPLPAELSGQVRILRGGAEIWAAEFLSGQDHMCHAISNLEHHHFKYPGFRRPGDIHVYFFGASVLSFSEGVSLLPGDTVEVSQPLFGRPLRNGIVQESDAGLVSVIPLDGS